MQHKWCPRFFFNVQQWVCPVFFLYVRSVGIVQQYVRKCIIRTARYSSSCIIIAVAEEAYLAGWVCGLGGLVGGRVTVSYTHLTLPTILLV